jgi:hypothetical protein
MNKNQLLKNNDIDYNKLNACKEEEDKSLMNGKEEDKSLMNGKEEDKSLMNGKEEDKSLMNGKEEDNDISDNLANNKIDTNITPKTEGNNVYVSICSCSVNFSCSIM